jgi:hypothetical protein
MRGADCRLIGARRRGGMQRSTAPACARSSLSRPVWHATQRNVANGYACPA